MRTPTTVAVLAAAALALSACGSDSEAADTTGPLKVGASPVPHAEILQYVEANLAEEAGLDLEVVEFTDYVQPNVALDDGSIDANYFQHEPYLQTQEADAGYDFTTLAPVHLEPLGLYSEKVADVDELGAGAEVAIPNDPTNAGRALDLLEQAGLLTLADTGDQPATVLDVADNPLDLRLTEIEAAQLPRSLADVDAAVINGNYAIEAGLTPAEDALVAESATENPYANLLVARADAEDDPRLQQLVELLQSPEVAEYIETTYEGAVVPAS
jgi:D-methionine transport system substrate-binding protein